MYIDEFGVHFSDDKKTLIGCPRDFQGEYIIPDSVTEIGWGVFFGCTGLTSIIIPDSVEYIGGWAFSACSSLTSVIISNSVTVIDRGAFSDCNNLEEIIVPKGTKVFFMIKFKEATIEQNIIDCIRETK